MNEQKTDFLKDELWTLTIGAAFQRSNVYRGIPKDFDKQAFKKSLRTFIQTEILPIYKNKVDDKLHIKTIKRICNFSKKQNVKMNFGVSQKLLNLYLKYQWCLRDEMPEPPHFPVDRIIQQKLKIKNPFAWTKMEDETKYLEVINIARNVLRENKHKECNNSLAQLELKLFNRRNNKP